MTALSHASLRPVWIRLVFWGLSSRREAVQLSWACACVSAIGLVGGFLYPMLWLLVNHLVLLVWLGLAIRWADREGAWAAIGA